MEYVIKHGTGFSVEVGSPEEPEITRWTSWGNGDLQQSFMLHTLKARLSQTRCSHSRRSAQDTQAACW